MKTLKDVFLKDKYPQLYSKRGFEKGRIKIEISNNRCKLAIISDNKGNILDIEL